MRSAGLAPIVALAAFPAPSSAQKPPICTLIGCVSGVTIDVRALKQRPPRAARITACVNKRCRRFSPKSDFVRINDPRLSGEGPVRVRLVVRDRRGRVVVRVERQVRLRRVQPNGPSCPPTCWVRSLRLDPTRRRLVVTT